jgi:hypothetical protein
VAIELTETSKRLRATLDDNLPGGTRNWTRGLAAGALITGAVLLASGRRKSGLLATGAGAIVALLEDSEAVREVWEALPAYLKTGQEMLGRFETFIGELAAQGDKIRKMINAQAHSF